MTQDLTPVPAEPLDVQAALDQGQYTPVIARLEAHPPTDAATWRVLGQAYLRAGRTLDAELPLRRGLALGDRQAHLAYGNWLRTIGQFAGAVRELAAVIAGAPDGELKCLAQMVQGIALFRLGEVGAGLDAAQAGWVAYPPQAAPHRRARLARVLGQMHLHLGALECALTYQEAGAAALEHEPEPVARFMALRDLARVQARLGKAAQAQASYQAAGQTLSAGQCSEAGSLRVRALRRGAEAERLALVAEPGSQRPAAEALRDLFGLASALHDSELRLFAVTHLADALSRQGHHARAMHTLYELGTPRGLPPGLGVLRGILMCRQRQYPQAIRDLEQAGSILEADPLLYWRAQLRLADAYYQDARPVEGLRLLGRALNHLVTVEDRRIYLGDWQELGELVQHALLEPDLAPLMESLLSESGSAAPPLIPGAADSASGRPRLELRLLGPAAATLNGEPCLLPAGALLILCYLHLSPGRSRNDLMGTLFPDFDRTQTTAYFRLAVRELRAALGPDILLLDDTLRHPRYRLGNVELETDLSELRRALAHSDLGAALKLYQGAFMEDLEPESDWADGVRGELRMTLNLELQERLHAARTAPTLRRALKEVERVLDTDPEVEAAAEELEVAVQAAQQRLAVLDR